MKLVIITGMSGAGKSRAVEVMEDMDFYCVDNMPIDFLIKFAEICLESQDKFSKVALVTDVRSGNDFEKFISDLDEIRRLGVDFTLIFIDANDDTIVKRYKETRRRHPLEIDGEQGSIRELIAKERKMLMPLYDHADKIIDTSYYTPAQLKEQMQNIYSEGASKIKLNVVSFGYKYGIPAEADMVFDVRCLPNPYYDFNLKYKTGLDAEVRDFIMGYQCSKKYLEKMIDMTVFLKPLFKEEGKSTVNIAIGCTGGRHRSVTFAKLLGEALTAQGSDVAVSHRDIDK